MRRVVDRDEDLAVHRHLGVRVVPGIHHALAEPWAGSVLLAVRLVYARLQRRGAAVTKPRFWTSCREYGVAAGACQAESGAGFSVGRNGSARAPSNTAPRVITENESKRPLPA